MKVVCRQLSPVSSVSQAVQSARCVPPEDGVLLRLEIPLSSSQSPLCWLQAQPPGQRLYWSDRDGQGEVAVLGFADHRPVHDLPHLPQGGGVRWFAGAAFDPTHRPPPEWAPFGQGCLILPLLALHRQEEKHWVVIHRLSQAPPLPSPRPVSTAISPPIRATSQHTEPTADVWVKQVQAATAAMAEDRFQKVVLSRRTCISLLDPPDPFALLATLAAHQVHAFSFCFEMAGGHAFLGCSPERLFSRDGRELHTEALAGTRRRGQNAREDDQLAAHLLNATKDREEHHHVVHAIQTALTPLCDRLHIPQAPVVHRLHRVQHLHTPISGKLSINVTDADVLDALHPTPAVCGLPRREARAFIGGTEPFGRGWYAGPVGWFEKERAECAVGIRSALLHGHDLWICAGAGLVTASDPQAEWQELITKSEQFLALVEGA